MHIICIKNENTQIYLPYGKINLIGPLTVNPLFRSKCHRTTNGHWNLTLGNAIFYWNSNHFILNPAHQIHKRYID